jgi:hypothetical protein
MLRSCGNTDELRMKSSTVGNTVCSLNDSCVVTVRWTSLARL